jgi:hypothetical protein
LVLEKDKFGMGLAACLQSDRAYRLPLHTDAIETRGVVRSGVVKEARGSGGAIDAGLQS